MKTQANIALLIFAVFVGWLFYQTYEHHQIKKERLELDSRELSLQEAKEQRLRENQSGDKYSIVNDPDGMTYLLNTENGETWRWYRNYKKGTSELESEGWIPVVFSVGGFDYTDISAAQDANERMQIFMRESAMKNLLNSSQQSAGGDAKNRAPQP